MPLASAVLMYSSGRGRTLGLFVFGVQDVHGRQQDVRDVPPHLITEEPESGHHGVDFALIQRDDLKSNVQRTVM